MRFEHNAYYLLIFAPAIVQKYLNNYIMTKKQVLFSLRQRIGFLRECAECSRDKEDKMDPNSMYDYHCGCVDSFDLILEQLCDYD